MVYKYRKYRGRKRRKKRNNKFAKETTQVYRITPIGSLDDDGRYFVLLQLPNRFSG